MIWTSKSYRFWLLKTKQAIIEKNQTRQSDDSKLTLFVNDEYLYGVSSFISNLYWSYSDTPINRRN
jgi:hypothetical protein